MGGPTRFPYGEAWGFQNQFSFSQGPVVSGTAGLFTQSDLTPDVTIGQLFIANNTGATTITYFDLQNYAYKAAEYSGKEITVMVIDNGSTTFANAGQLVLGGTDNLANNAGYPAFYQFVHFNSTWYQIDSFKGSRSEVTTFVTNVQSSLNMNGVRVAILNNTGSSTNTIIGLSGGQIGQEITFMLQGSNAVRLVTGNMTIVGTNAVLINASGMYKFIKHTDNVTWRAMTINSAGWSA